MTAAGELQTKYHILNSAVKEESSGAGDWSQPAKTGGEEETEERRHLQLQHLYLDGRDGLHPPRGNDVHYTLHYITLHYTLRYILHYITLHYITFCITFYITLHFTLHYITFYITLHFTLHYILHYITVYITLPFTLHYILHYITFYITLHFTLHYI